MFEICHGPADDKFNAQCYKLIFSSMNFFLHFVINTNKNKTVLKEYLHLVRR